MNRNHAIRICTYEQIDSVNRVDITDKLLIKLTSCHICCLNATHVATFRGCIDGIFKLTATELLFRLFAAGLLLLCEFTHVAFTLVHVILFRFNRRN